MAPEPATRPGDDPPHSRASVTTEPIPASPGRRGPSKALRFAIAFILGVTLVVGAGGGALYAYGQQYTGRVLPGVGVADTDLSGLSPDAAVTALESAYGSLGTGQVLLAGPDGEFMIGYAEMGRGPDTTAMLDAALAAGRRGEPVVDLIGAPQTAIRGVTLEPAVTYDPARLAEAVDAVAMAIDRNPKNATLAVGGDWTYATTPSVEGRVVDRAALAAAIEAAIGPLDAPSEIRLDIPFATEVPAIETADVEAATAAADRMAADLVLTRGDDAWTIPAASIRQLISFVAADDGSVVPVLDEAGIAPLIKPIAKTVNQSAKSAGFKFSGKRVVVVGSSREGRKLDAEATQAVVLDALMARQAGTPEPVLEPVVAVTEPSVTTEQANAIAPKMRPISTWTTKFPIWSHNAFGANIWVPAGIINGTVVGPGETFDFWNTVGEVNRDKGYGLGGAIVNGRTEAQGAIGGGICSCSTTLFNAALRAGLRMGARSNHIYYIDRYPLGLDATVWIMGGGRQTVTFTNDMAHSIYVRGIRLVGRGGQGYVRYEIWGVPDGRRVSIGAPVVRNAVRATTKTVTVTTLPPGVRKQTEWPANGMDVWVTRVVRAGSGRVIHRDTYYSHYRLWNGRIEVGALRT